MKQQTANNVKVLLAVITAVVFFTACNKKFDEPPGFIDPNVTANMTIAQLKALYTGSAIVKVTDDKIIEGVVVADDKSGNFYKSIVIQDASGGVQVLLGGTNLYTSYPIGRKLYIKCKDLYIGEYNNLIQLGGFIDSTDPVRPALGDLPVNLFDKHILKGQSGNPITPIDVSIDQLNDSYQNMLIRIDSCEFRTSDTARTYADAVNLLSANRTIRDIFNRTIIVRSSGYANFAPLLTPKGSGSVTAIYTIFGSTKQLVIRDENDVKMTNPRLPGLITLFNQDFETVATSAAISLTGWKNAAEVGGRSYTGQSFSSNKYAQITAFSSNQAAVTSWLVTPGINLGATTGEVFTFRSKDGFNNGAVLKAYISTNYDGVSNTPWTATWTELSCTIASGSTSGFASSFTNSGNINLAGYNGVVYIAFKYTGADPAGTGSDQTTTFQVDDVRVTGFQ
jgi:Family of unknown function (DUF5689)